MIQMTMDICAMNSNESLRLKPIHPCESQLEINEKCLEIVNIIMEAPEETRLV